MNEIDSQSNFRTLKWPLTITLIRDSVEIAGVMFDFQEVNDCDLMK